MRTKIQLIGSILSFIVQIIGWAMAGKTIAFWLMGLIGSIAFAVFMGWMVYGYYNQLKVIENVKPNLVLKKVRGWQFHTKGVDSYYALQGWFTNNPKVPSDNSIAKDVTATMTFYDNDGKREFEMYGCWTQPRIVEGAEIVEAKDLRDKIDLFSPNDIPQKLLIAVKWPSDEIAYGLSKSNFYKGQNLKESGKELKRGTHYVKILFRVVNIGQEPFWFDLTNFGQGRDLSISELTAPPSFDKRASRI